MSRNEEFSSGSGKMPLFHGTTATLKLGDIVYPSTHDKHPNGKTNQWYRDAEVDQDVDNYMDERENDDWDEDDDRTEDEVRSDYSEYASHHWDNAWATPDLDGAKSYANRGQGKVYQVEHLSPEGCEGCSMYKNSNAADHTDSSGFRVVKQVQ
jgi:hypothetical protein